MKIISVSSGKGGVGKTTLSCSLSYILADLGYRVLILDADLGCANVDIHFGIKPQKNLSNVFEGSSVKECLTPVMKNIDLLAGVSGILELTQLSPFQRRELAQQIQDLEFSYDIAIVDNSSGIYDHVLHLNAVSDHSIIVINSDAASFADAYALIKVLNKNYKIQNFQIIVNKANEEEAQLIYFKFSEVVYRFLNVKLQLLGSVRNDHNLCKIHQAYRIILNSKMISPLYKDLSLIAQRLLNLTLDNYSLQLDHFTAHAVSSQSDHRTHSSKSTNLETEGSHQRRGLENLLIQT